jgi:hypothetical protein
MSFSGFSGITAGTRGSFANQDSMTGANGTAGSSANP